MKTVLVYGLLSVALFAPASVRAVEQAPRITDREIIERLTRLEEGQKALGGRIETLEQHVNQRLDDLEQRINQRLGGLEQRLGGLEQQLNNLEQRLNELRQLVLWGVGVTFAGMFALVGFVLWDRRTALAPAVRRIEELQEREHVLEEVLRRYALKVPELAEELRRARLL